MFWDSSRPKNQYKWNRNAQHQTHIMKQPFFVKKGMAPRPWAGGRLQHLCTQHKHMQHNRHTPTKASALSQNRCNQRRCLVPNQRRCFVPNQKCCFVPKQALLCPQSIKRHCSVPNQRRCFAPQSKALLCPQLRALLCLQ